MVVNGCLELDQANHQSIPLKSRTLSGRSFVSDTATMKLPPPEILKTWPKPNYVNPHTRGSGVLVVNIIFVCIAFVVTCLRLYTRLKITSSPGLDDVMIVIAMVSRAVGLVTVRLLILYTGSRHSYVYGHIACSRATWLEPPYLGYPHALVPDYTKI